MRILSLKIGLLALFSAAGLNTAVALPLDDLSAAARLQAPIVPVQLVCNQSRCIDPDTGAYTYSNCDRRGCRPSSGIVGYTRPDGGGGGRRSRRDYDDYDDDFDRPRRSGRYDGGGRYDCNPSRCIDTRTGQVLESTCNRGGCSPLGPARGGRGGGYGYDPRAGYPNVQVVPVIPR